MTSHLTSRGIPHPPHACVCVCVDACIKRGALCRIMCVSMNVCRLFRRAWDLSLCSSASSATIRSIPLEPPPHKTRDPHPAQRPRGRELPAAVFWSTRGPAMATSWHGWQVPPLNLSILQFLRHRLGIVNTAAHPQKIGSTGRPLQPCHQRRRGSGTLAQTKLLTRALPPACSTASPSPTTPGHGAVRRRACS